MRSLFTSLALLIAALTAAPAWAAQPVSSAPVFATAPVSDSTLSELRGGQSPFASLTIGAATRLADSQARADFRQTGGIARITMDVWWGSTGSELIATSVRAAGQR